MQIQATWNFRRSAALLILISGITHIGQLWFRETSGEALLTALVGAYYLLLALGLLGQSRFVLWLTSASTSTAVLANASSGLQQAESLQGWHVGLETVVACLCFFVLFRTRFDDMD